MLIWILSYGITLTLLWDYIDDSIETEEDSDSNNKTAKEDAEVIKVLHQASIPKICKHIVLR